MSGPSRQRGASLIETSVTLIIAGIMLAGLGTGVYSTVLDARERAVVNQLEGIKRAIAGDSHSGSFGEGDGGRYGRQGDMGSLPATLNDLLVAGSQPDYAVDSLLQVGAGWRGPYLSTAVANEFQDPWGGALVYNATPGASTVTGAATVATIRSTGPDRQNDTADDYLVEVYKSETQAKVRGLVRDDTGLTVSGVGVTLSYPNNGILTSQTTTTDDSGLYAFDDIPHGYQVVQLTPKLTFQRGTALTTGGNRNNVEFFVENMAQLATTVSSIKLSWTTTPASDFKRLLVAGVQVYNATAPSDTTIPFSSKTVTGTGVIQEPFRIEVSGLAMQVPDAVIGSVGTGGTLKFEMQDFEETGDTADVDMTGVTFTVEFSDGSKTQFSPLRK